LIGQDLQRRARRLLCGNHVRDEVADLAHCVEAARGR
jgi:hypothetical protein